MSDATVVKGATTLPPIDLKNQNASLAIFDNIIFIMGLIDRYMYLILNNAMQAMQCTKCRAHVKSWYELEIIRIQSSQTTDLALSRRERERALSLRYTKTS